MELRRNRWKDHPAKKIAGRDLNLDLSCSKISALKKQNEMFITENL